MIPQTMPEENIVFLYNRTGELNDEDLQVPLDTQQWYEDIENNELGYMVNIDNQPGFLFISEFSHMGQTPNFCGGYEFARDNGNRTEEDVWEFINQLAIESSYLFPANQVYVGRQTGPDSSHELGLFIPSYFPPSAANNAINKIFNIISQEVKKRWGEAK